MENQQITASAVISYCEKLEDSTLAFYEALGAMFPAHRDVFSGFVDESRKNKVLLVRTYRETVSDALETGFAFEGLELEADLTAVVVSDSTELAEGLVMALELEESAADFYTKVASRVTRV